MNTNKIQYTNKYNQPSFNYKDALGQLGIGLLGQFGSGMLNQFFNKRNPMMQNSPNRMMQDMNTPSITGQNNMMNFYQEPMMNPMMMQLPNMVNFKSQMYKEPRKNIRMDENKYSLYRQPKRLYQDTQYTVSGGDTAINNLDTSAQSPASGQFGGGGGFDKSKLGGYANAINFVTQAFSDPTKNIAGHYNANLQNTPLAPSDLPISTLNENEPITFSDNFRGGSATINQLNADEMGNIIDGQVPADAGMGGALMSGASGAATGFMVGGPVGAAIGFGIGTLGSMIGDQKKSDKRSEIQEDLTAQNNAAFGSGAAMINRANQEELTRFLV